MMWGGNMFNDDGIIRDFCETNAIFEKIASRPLPA